MSGDRALRSFGIDLETLLAENAPFKHAYFDFFFINRRAGVALRFSLSGQASYLLMSKAGEPLTKGH